MFDKKEKEVLGFNDLPLVVAQAILYSFLSMAIMFPDLLLSGRFGLYALQWLEALMYMIIYLLAGRVFYLFIVRKYPGYSNWRRRAPRLPLILVVYLGMTIILQLTLQRVINIEIAGYVEDRVLKEVIMGTFFALFGVALYESIYLFVALKEDQLRLKSLEKEKVQNQLNVLKHQLSPHFLFNCFNSLNYVIDESQEKGKEFVNKLADVHKKILEVSEKDMITLEEELEYTYAYMDLLKKRFSDNLVINTSIKQETLQKKIIPLALQISVENAVKHNVISKKMPLTIEITERDGYIAITNNFQPKANQQFSHGLGLKNIKDRYKMITKKEVSIERNANSFTLKLPILAK